MTHIENIKWVVVWESGRTETFVPYDSYGMSSFIRQGLKRGKVFVNDKEVEEYESDTWGTHWREKND